MRGLIALALLMFGAVQAQAVIPCPGGTMAGCYSPYYAAVTAINVTASAGVIAGPWSTAGRPAAPVAGQAGYNSTLSAWEWYNGSSWVSGGGGGIGGLLSYGSIAITGSGPPANFYVVDLALNHSNTWTADQKFTSGTGGLYATNTGSPTVNGAQLGQGALEWRESSWLPATQSLGRWASYATIVLDAVGLTNRSIAVADQWNASLFGLYLQATTSAALNNSHFVGAGFYTIIPPGLGDGLNGGTWSGGLPGNAIYKETGGVTAVAEMGSPGMYAENMASYICDNIGCGTGTGVKSRMTGYLAAMYKNYAGPDYGMTGFICDSLGTQQTTPNAPSSCIRALGGLLVGLDFSGVTNVAAPGAPGFIAMELPGAHAIASDALDLYLYVNNTLVVTANTTSFTLARPLVTPLYTGTVSGAACYTADGILIYMAGANCYGGSIPVASFNGRSGAVVLSGSDVVAAGSFLASGGTISGVTHFTAAYNPVQIDNALLFGAGGTWGIKTSAGDADLQFWNGSQKLLDFDYYLGTVHAAVFSVSPDTASAGVPYYSAGVMGVSCAGINAGTFASTGGIVTHC